MTYRTLGPRSSYAISATQRCFATGAPVMTVTDNLTMEVWCTAYGFVGGYQALLYNGNDTFSESSGGGSGYGLAQTDTAGGKKLIVAECGSGGSLSSNGNIPIGSSGAGDPNAIVAPGGTFSHCVIVRRAGVWEYWVGGVQDNADPARIKTPATPTSETHFYNFNFSVSFVNISIVLAFAALYNTALSGARIQAHYNAMKAWPATQPIRDEFPTAPEAGAFTTKGGNGLIPDVPPAFAEYDFLSWLGVSGATQYADGAGTSVYP